MLCLRRQKFVVTTTNSNHDRPVYPNLAGSTVCVADNRPGASSAGRTPALELTGINQLWIADITYIRLETEFVYLAVVLDAYSRRVIGWALGRTLEDDLTIAALRMALRLRSSAPGLVHHSDRACSTPRTITRTFSSSIRSGLA